MKSKRKIVKDTTSVGSRNGLTCTSTTRTTKLTRKAIDTAKSEYQGPKFSSAENPLIDDLLGELGTSMASEETPSLSLENSENGTDSGGFSENYLCRENLAPLDGSSSLKNLSMLAVDAVVKASRCFVHTLTKHDLKSYLNCPTSAAKEAEMRRHLRSKDSGEVENFVLALLEIIEEVLSVRERLKGLALPSMHLPSAEENDMSGSLASVISTASLMCPPVHETNQLAVAFDQKGHRTINRYVLLANIGEGSYGKVKLAEEMDSGKKVAIKMIDKKFLQKKFGSGKEAGAGGGDNALMREITIMKKVRHRNCVSLYEVIDDPASQKLYLIMDYVPNGPVVHLRHHRLLPAMLFATEAGHRVNGVRYNRELIRCAIRHRPDGDGPLTEAELYAEPAIYSCRPLPEATCARYLRQLVSGLRYMHDRRVVHHDVKPENVLLGADGRVYLTDFGVSEILTAPGAAANARLGGGTLLFTAPELLEPGADLAAVDPFRTDHWALGVTLYCMLVGVVPFGGASYRGVCESIRGRGYLWNGRNLEGDELLPEWNTILAGLLEKTPERRWGLRKLKCFLDSEDFQQKLRMRAGAASAAASERRRTSVINIPSPKTLVCMRGVNGVVEGVAPPLTESLTKSSGFCRASGIRRECVQEVARSEGIAVVTRPAKTVSKRTREIVRGFADAIRARTASKNMYFKESDLFPPSEGGVTDSIGSAKVSEDLLRMHNLSGTENNYEFAVRSSGSSNGRGSRSGNIPNWEKPSDNRKKPYPASAGLSQSQPSFVPVGKRNSRAVYSGAFQSIDAILSIVNVQSESFRSNSFSFVSVCEAGSQKSSTFSKGNPSPATGLEITLKCMPDSTSTSGGAIHASSLARLSGYSSLDQRGGGGMEGVETPLLVEPSSPVSQSETKKLSNSSLTQLERELNSTLRGKGESKELAGRLEFEGSSPVSIASMFPTKSDSKPSSEERGGSGPKETPRASLNKGNWRNIQGGSSDMGSPEPGQMRVSDMAASRRISRPSKEPKRRERGEKKSNGKSEQGQQQLASTKEELPSILSIRPPPPWSKLTSWEVMRNGREGTFEAVPLPDKS